MDFPLAPSTGNTSSSTSKAEIKLSLYGLALFIALLYRHAANTAAASNTSTQIE